MGALALFVGVRFVVRRDVHGDLVSAYLYNVSQKKPPPSGTPRRLLPSPSVKILPPSHTRSLAGVALCRIFAPWILQATLGIRTGVFVKTSADWFFGVSLAIL